MTEIRNCSWCGAEYEYFRRDKLTCSKPCSAHYSRKRNKVPKGLRVAKADAVIGDLRRCKICGMWKNKNSEYKHSLGVSTRTCKVCLKEGANAKKRIEDKSQLFLDVEKFVLDKKRNHYICYAIDVWILIDLYDRVFPTKSSLPHMGALTGDIEKSAIEMFESVARWYADELKVKETFGRFR